jgi:molecular chaperone HscB
VPDDLLEEAFELNMQLEEMRAAKKMGEDEPELRQELLRAKSEFESKLAATDADLENLWSQWDAAVDANNEAGKAIARDGMVGLLNRRSYLRNLVRDVNDALE